MITSHGLVNNSILPIGAQTVRRALIQHSDGIVREHRTFLHQGEFKTAVQTIDTVNRGVLLPSWQIPKPMTTGRATVGSVATNLPARPYNLATENKFQQTGATAPVGTTGPLKNPLPTYAKQARLFGSPVRE